MRLSTANRVNPERTQARKKRRAKRAKRGLVYEVTGTVPLEAVAGSMLCDDNSGRVAERGPACALGPTR
jgi:hypothetical protein